MKQNKLNNLKGNQIKGVQAMNGLTAAHRKIVREEKMAYVFNLLLKGWTQADISKAYAAHYGETVRNGRNIYTKVMAQLDKDAENDRNRERNKMIAQFDLLYKMNLENGNTKEAASCLAQKMKLQGLESPKQIEQFNYNVNGPQQDDQFAHLSLEQKKEVLKLLNPGKPVP